MEKKICTSYEAPITEVYNVGNEALMDGIEVSGEMDPGTEDAKEGTLGSLDEDMQDGLPYFNIWED